MNGLIEKFLQFRRPFVFIIVALGHLALLLHFKINIETELEKEDPSVQIMKLVDVTEYIPPPPPSPPPEPIVPEETLEVSNQPAISESVIEVEQEVIESERGISVEKLIPVAREPEYLPQHKISKIPEIPTDEILGKIIYPPIALRRELEAVVFLELFIDQNGNIGKIEILRDPGNGFAEAALKALDGLKCIPAEANGKKVAVRFRYPVRFCLNH